jgi:hypothetical protein
VLQWKAASDLTFSADLSYYREDGWNLTPATVFAAPRAQGANAYGAALYASYKYSELVKLNARLE